MKTAVFWAYDGHREAFQQAVLTCKRFAMDWRSYVSASTNKRGNRSYGSALYLLTGLEDAWPRIKPRVTANNIDYDTILELCGPVPQEYWIAELSQNLCACCLDVSFTPLTLIGALNPVQWELVMTGLALCRGTIPLPEPYPANN